MWTLCIHVEQNIAHIFDRFATDNKRQTGQKERCTTYKRLSMLHKAALSHSRRKPVTVSLSKFHFTCVSMDHSCWARSRWVTKSKARLRCQKLAGARKDSVVCTVVYTPKLRFRSRLFWWPQLMNFGFLWEWSILSWWQNKLHHNDRRSKVKLADDWSLSAAAQIFDDRAVPWQALEKPADKLHHVSYCFLVK